MRERLPSLLIFEPNFISTMSLRSSRFVGSTMLFAMALLCAACHTTETVEGGPMGTIMGRVYLFDSDGNILPLPVTIVVPSVDRLTRSDASGRWSLSNVPLGSYDIAATCDPVGSNVYDTLYYYGVICSADTTLL